MKRAVAWLKAVFQWITKPHLVWMAVLVVVFAGIIAIHPGVSEIQIRISGLVLQLLGLSTVVYGIRETRKLFGRPSFQQLLREWLSRFPRWRRDIVIEPGAASLVVTAGGAGVHVWTNIDPAAPIEAQLIALTRNVERMNERLIQMQKDSDSELRKHSESLRQERKFREEGDDHLHKRLEAAETGGLHISLLTPA